MFKPGTMTAGLIGILFSVLLLSIPAIALCQQPAKPDYASLLDRVMKSDPTVDFAALRYAHFDNPPKESDVSSDAEKTMHSAFRNKDYDQALKSASEIIAGNFVDIDAHVIAAIVYGQKNDKEKETFHRYVVDGLVKSILKSGDGKTPATAYVVISTEEEYTVLRFLSLAPGNQALLTVGGHSFDKLMATDPKTTKGVEIYFNIDRPFGAEQKLFGK